MLSIAVLLNAMIILGAWLGVLGALSIIAVNESYLSMKRYIKR